MTPRSARSSGAAAHAWRPPAPGGGPAAPGARAPATVRYLGTDDRSSTRVRAVDAALRCIARNGVQRTTVDDIAQEAGVSRVTLYRTFPGGRDGVLAAVVETEVARLFSAVAVAMGEARDLEDVLVAGMVEAARWLSGHAALATVMDQEPGLVLSHLAFSQMDGVLLATAELTAPFFARWLEPDQAARAAEWATRILFSYLVCPGEGIRTIDLADPDQARHLVTTFVIPGIQALRMAAADPTSRKER